MHKLEFEQVLRQTRQTVGKFDFERIVGKHAVACLKILSADAINADAFIRGVEWKSIQTEWEESVLYNVFSADDSRNTDYAFEKAVRKVINKFFQDCVSIMQKQAPVKDANNAKQVELYANLTCQTRRSVAEIQKLFNEYKDALKQVSTAAAASAAAGESETYYIYAVGLLYAANKLGYFLDMELSK